MTETIQQKFLELEQTKKAILLQIRAEFYENSPL